MCFQELSYQPLCSLGVAATLDQNVNNETILIDGTPCPVFLARDRDGNLIEVLLSPSLPADRFRISLAKCLPNFSAQSLTIW